LKMIKWIVRGYYWCDTDEEWNTMKVHLGQCLITTRAASMCVSGQSAVSLLEAEWSDPLPWRPAGRKTPGYKLRMQQKEGIPGFYEDIESITENRRAAGGCMYGGVQGTFWLGWFVRDYEMSEADEAVQLALKVVAPTWILKYNPSEHSTDGHWEDTESGSSGADNEFGRDDYLQDHAAYYDEDY
jgi:hypothetical protein